MQKMKLKYFRKGTKMILLVMLFCFVALPAIVFAAVVVPPSNISILEAGKTIDGFGFFAGNQIRVDGNVEGTTFVTGQDVTINGSINGDLFVAAQTISVNGTVSGNIYCAGQSLALNGQSTGDVFLGGQSINLEKGSRFGRDLFAGGATIMLNGSVQRDFHAGGGDVSINGTVGRDAKLEGGNIMILDQAVINGNLFYKSDKEAVINSSSKIVGQTDWEYVDRVDRTPEKKVNKPIMALGVALLNIASALLLWFIIRIWKPEIWKKTSETITLHPAKTLGIGTIALIVTPILSILLMITIIGIPIGVLLGIAFAISLYLSKLIVAVFIGSWMSTRFGWVEIHKGVWMVLLGLVILTLLGMIPILKLLVWLILVVTGLGAIVSVNMKRSTSVETAVAEKQL